jgi:hypothetical protein
MVSKDQAACAIVRVWCVSTISLIPVTFFAGCTHYRASNVEPGISRPRNIEQLLSNIKLAFDRGLLLDPAFYSDNNLMTVFDGTSVQWHSVRFSSNTRQAVITLDPSPNGIKTVGVRISKGSGLSRGVYIDMQVAPSSGMRLGDVRKVFGGEASTIPKMLPTDVAPDANNTAHLPDPAIAYVKQTPPTGTDRFPARVTVKFSAEVHDRNAAWQRWGAGGVKPKPLPDDASVTSMSLNVEME